MTDRELLESLLEKITSIEANMATKDDIARLEAKIDKLESDSQEDVKAMLNHVDKKTDSLQCIESKIDKILATQTIQGESINILAMRQLNVESEIEALKRAK